MVIINNFTWKHLKSLTNCFNNLIFDYEHDFHFKH